MGISMLDSATHNSRWRKLSRYIVGLVLLATLCFIVLLPTMPPYRDIFGGDTGVFLYIGEQILRGNIPYRDVWDHKAPLIYYINALALLIGGGSIWGLWFVELLSLWCAAFIGFVLIDRGFGWLPALFSTILWVASLALVLIGGNYTEEFALPFQFAALYLFWRSEQQKRYGWRSLAIGVTLAACFLLRPNLVGIHMAIVAVMVWGGMRSRNWGRLLLTLGLITAGAMAVLLIVAVYFFSQHALSDLVDQVFRYSTFYSATTIQNRISSWLAGIAVLAISGISIVALFSWITGLRRLPRELERQQDVNILLLFAIVNVPIEFVLSTLSGRVYGHYYVSWMPAFAILAASFACFVAEEARLNLTPKQIGVALLALAAALCIGPAWTVVDDAKTPKQLENSRYQSASYILAYTKDNDPILVWGAETALNLVTHRNAPTRYVYQYPLYTRGYQTTAMVEEFFRDLASTPPAVIIDTSTTNSLVPPLEPSQRATWAPDDPSFVLLPEMNDVLAYIDSNYVFVGRIGREQWSLYRYVGRQSAGAESGRLR
jgi:Dolichyl-phosphate-mannose-protein mannosyltransferase